MTPDPRITNWIDRVDGTIQVEVIRMHHHKSAWDRVFAMLADSPDLPDSYWWEFTVGTPRSWRKRHAVPSPSMSTALS